MEVNPKRKPFHPFEGGAKKRKVTDTEDNEGGIAEHTDGGKAVEEVENAVVEVEKAAEDGDADVGVGEGSKSEQGEGGYQSDGRQTEDEDEEEWEDEQEGGDEADEENNQKEAGHQRRKRKAGWKDERN